MVKQFGLLLIVEKTILLVLLASALNIAPQATAKISTRVCLADGNTPLEPINITPTLIEYPDIMVGTKLTIIVDSNTSERWDGGLFIEDPYRDYGVLSGRDYNDVTWDWEGSRFEAASEDARVYDYQDDLRSGFDLYGDRYAVPGNWFIIDYNATQIGQCKVGFYDYGGPGGMDVPICYIVFSHVRTRDFNKDTKVDSCDFAILASYWQGMGCNDPNWCEGTDLDTDGYVDSNDLMLFTDYWLERTK